jgi:predicted secreted Zn-dependent protease
VIHTDIYNNYSISWDGSWDIPTGTCYITAINQVLVLLYIFSTVLSIVKWHFEVKIQLGTRLELQYKAAVV